MRSMCEILWLWKAMGISVVTAAIFVASAALICKGKGKKLNAKIVVFSALLGIIAAMLVINTIACTPMPL